MLIVMLFACTAGFVMGSDIEEVDTGGDTASDTGDTGVIDTGSDTNVDTEDTSTDTEDTGVDTATHEGLTRIAADYLSMDATAGNYYDVGYEGDATGVGVYCSPGMTADLRMETGYFRVTMHAWDPAWAMDTKVISACVLVSDQNAIPWTLETLRPW